MNVELTIKSGKIPGLTRKFDFPIKDELDLETVFMIHLRDEIEKLRDTESELLQWMSGTGKKIRF